MSVAHPLAVLRRGLGPACSVTVRDRRETPTTSARIKGLGAGEADAAAGPAAKRRDTRSAQEAKRARSPEAPKADAVRLAPFGCPEGFLRRRQADDRSRRTRERSGRVRKRHRECAAETAQGLTEQRPETRQAHGLPRREAQRSLLTEPAREEEPAGLPDPAAAAAKAAGCRRPHFPPLGYGLTLIRGIERSKERPGAERWPSRLRGGDLAAEGNSPQAAEARERMPLQQCTRKVRSERRRGGVVPARANSSPAAASSGRCGGKTPEYRQTERT